MEPDQKRLLIAIVLGIALVFAWYPAVTWIGEKFGYDFTTPPIEETTDPKDSADPADPTTREAVAEVENMDPADPVDTPAGDGTVITPIGEVAAVTLGSTARDDPTYALGVELTPNGGGVASVVLNGFKRDVDAEDPYVFEKAYEGGGDVTRPFTPQSVVIGGETVSLVGAEWGLAESTQTTATYGVRVGELVEVYVDYAVTDKSAEGSGYEVQVVYRIANLTGEKLGTQLVFAGPTTPPAELEDRPDRQIVAGFYEGEDFEVEQLIVQSFDEDQPSVNLGSELTDNAVMTWAGASTIYFQALVRPTLTEQQITDEQIPQPFDSIVATLLNPEVRNVKQREVALLFNTKPRTIAAGGTYELPLTVYFGPKLRALMQSDYY
ncbi:MAG: hypothetical protein AAF656_02790, partial [Planctomycetota bacterium]